MIASKSEIRHGMQIDWDAVVPADDGLELRADVFRPLGDGRHPAILTYGPYGKGLAFYDGHFKPVWDYMTATYPETAAATSNRYQVWETVDPERWVADGYAVVRIDGRGAGRSPGLLDMFSPRETRDMYDGIEWTAAQPWCSGKVGLNGISYYAMNQWRAAGLQPPHLAAMFAFEGAGDFYRDASRHGGILTDFWAMLMGFSVAPIQHGVGLRGYRNKTTGELVSGPPTLTAEELAANRVDTFRGQMAHELDDDFYRDRSPQWDKVKVPFLSSGSWGGQGLHLRGNTEAFVRAASDEKYLEMHGLEHWTHFYTEYGYGLQKRFFDYYLKDIDNGFKSERRVRLQVRHPGERFEERFEDEWPIARTEWTKFYLDPAGHCLTREPPAAPGQVSYAGFGDGVTFLSDPFERETEITGPSAAKLFVSSETTDADLFLVLRLFSPDLREEVFIGSQEPNGPLTLGWLRASHRKLDPALSTPWQPWHTHDEKQPLTPGVPVECDVEVWPTSIVVPAGYRIGLSVRGRDYVTPSAKPIPIATRGPSASNGVGALFHNVGADRPAAIFGGTVTLHSEPGKAPYILLPVIPAR
jgi:predicted acyl esterase